MKRDFSKLNQGNSQYIGIYWEKATRVKTKCTFQRFYEIQEYYQVMLPNLKRKKKIFNFGVIHLLIYVVTKHLLNTYCLSGTVLGCKNE